MPLPGYMEWATLEKLSDSGQLRVFLQGNIDVPPGMIIIVFANYTPQEFFPDKFHNADNATLFFTRFAVRAAEVVYEVAEDVKNI